MSKKIKNKIKFGEKSKNGTKHLDKHMKIYPRREQKALNRQH